jgi:hypothetical protein
MVFSSPWNLVSDVSAQVDLSVEPPPYVEVSDLGYRSIREQVQAFVVAGANLDFARSGVYDSDFVSEKELMDLPPNPLNSPDFDLQAAFDYRDAVLDKARAFVSKRKEEALAKEAAALKAAAEKAAAEKAAASSAPVPAPAPPQAPPNA